MNLGTLANWLAFFAVLVPIGALAWSAVRHVGNEKSKRELETNERIQALAAIIYNDNFNFGAVAQVLAIYELASYKAQGKAIRRAAIGMREHFQGKGNVEIVAALDDLLMDVKK